MNRTLAEKLNIFVVVYLDDILIYTEDEGQGHVDSVKWVLESLRRWGLYANLKKCRFHQNKVHFLGYIVSKSGTRKEEERIESVKNWPEPKSVRDIQVLIEFANLCHGLVRGFSIAGPLISVLETTESPPARKPDVQAIKEDGANYEEKLISAEEFVSRRRASLFLTAAARLAFAR